MVILDVTPISRGIGTLSLSYFSAVDIKPGSIIHIPLRSRQVPALVISSRPAEESKAELKNSAFAVRRVTGKIKPAQIFLPQFIEAAHEAADFFAGTPGSVLAAVTTKAILESADKLTEIDGATTPLDAETIQEPYVLQADEEERLSHYKSLIREQFARKKSVFFCLPTIQDTKRIFEALPKGIEQFTFVLNASLSKKTLIETWNAILQETHPVLVIATGTFLSIPRKDIGTIVVEHENSSGFKGQTRPFVDIRTFAEMYARKLGARIVFGDLLLRTETVWRTRSTEMAEFAPLKFRSMSTTETTIVDMKKYKTLETPEFRILSNELEDLIKENKEENRHLFIFAARRGLAPMTVCGDCGTTVTCNRCSAPIILHGGKENYFLCHRCGERRSAEERCKVCNSWRLTTLGIGIELIADVLTNMFPDTKIFKMDKDSVRTHKQALEMAEEFYDSPGSILLGTEMALGYLEKPIENAAVAAIDSLFSIPDFRINEKIMSILLRMRGIAERSFIIQTRSRAQHVFDYAAKGNLMDFYREEIDERKKLGYPPFSMLIKVTARNSRDAISEDINLIEEILSGHDPLIFPAFIELVNKKLVMHALIKVDRKEWVDKNLLQKLRSLPQNISVNVDPESLL